MRLFIDECVPKPTRVLLRTTHYTLITVEALGLTGAKNGEILTVATQQRAVLVTTDRGLGHLQRFPLGTHAGIIVLKIPHPSHLDAVHRNLLTALRTFTVEQLAGALLIVDRQKSRLRRPL